MDNPNPAENPRRVHKRRKSATDYKARTFWETVYLCCITRTADRAAFYADQADAALIEWGLRFDQPTEKDSPSRTQSCDECGGNGRNLRDDCDGKGMHPIPCTRCGGSGTL